MDSLTETVKVIVGVVASLGGISLIKFLFFMRPERRIKNIEADEKELNVMKQLVDSLKQRIEQQDRKINELNQRIDNLYSDKHELERLNNELVRENNELKLKLMEAQHNICVRPNDECFKGRLPKRTYCRLKKLASGDYDAFYDESQETENKDENEDN